jgi:hypothetical protein
MPEHYKFDAADPKPVEGAKSWAIYTSDGKRYGAVESTFRTILASVVNAGLDIVRIAMYEWQGEVGEWQPTAIKSLAARLAAPPAPRDESRLLGDVVSGDDDAQHNGRQPDFTPPREKVTASVFSMQDVANVSRECQDLGRFLAHYQNGRLTLKPNQVTFIASALTSAGNMLEPLGMRPGAPAEQPTRPESNNGSGA